MFLSLAECWRLASFPYSSWKDLRDVAVDTDVDIWACVEDGGIDEKALVSKKASFLRIVR